ncbi:hypothetical protein [Shewanella colwelliana]|nr:hypothetical protein [Shewanella colwelliana]MCZ4338181.1 hypothetical protein [Shewanella colwelliana]
MGDFLQYAEDVYQDIHAQNTIENELSQILESGSLSCSSDAPVEETEA